ncbi:MAG: hypothetical protein GC164_11990 [Phycisphaera sp.]|nr:hypothetical protein [Phycisphaera sp.]
MLEPCWQNGARTVHDSTYQPGDPVIYRALKHSAHPGPRATEIEPEPMGEGYSYAVDKFWVVERIDEQGQLVLRTRRGKLHILPPDHPQVRRPNLWQRYLYRDRFPNLGDLHGMLNNRRATAS